VGFIKEGGKTPSSTITEESQEVAGRGWEPSNYQHPTESDSVNLNIVLSCIYDNDSRLQIPNLP
jgi:hypothetical protein